MLEQRHREGYPAWCVLNIMNAGLSMYPSLLKFMELMINIALRR
jgi:hypothetical protein